MAVNSSLLRMAGNIAAEMVGLHVAILKPEIHQRIAETALNIAEAIVAEHERRNAAAAERVAAAALPPRTVL